MKKNIFCRELFTCSLRLARLLARKNARLNVGSRAPIRGSLPLLGPAAGSVGSLRRMS
jgi:hypothetical protein